MLTKEFFALTGNLFHFLCLLKASPFDWNYKSNRMKTTPKSIRDFLWTKVLATAIGMSLVFRAVDCKLKGDNHNFFVVYCFVLVYLLYAIVTLIIVTYTKDICILYNAMLDYFFELQSKFTQVYWKVA